MRGELSVSRHNLLDAHMKPDLSLALVSGMLDQAARNPCQLNQFERHERHRSKSYVWNDPLRHRDIRDRNGFCWRLSYVLDAR